MDEFGLVNRRIREIPGGEHQVGSRPAAGRDPRKQVGKQRRTSRRRNERIGLEPDAVVGDQVGEERVLGAPIVDSAAQADHRLLPAERIPGDAEARTEVVPVGVDALGGRHIRIALQGGHRLKIVAQTQIQSQRRNGPEGILDVVRHVQGLE